MFIRFSGKALLAISVFICGTFMYDKFYVDAKRAKPVKPDSILYAKDHKNYQDNKYLDGNFDGYITVGEKKAALDYQINYETFEFIQKLNHKERALLNGLTVEVAVLAYQKLTPSEKQKLLQLKDVDRINLINSRFEKLVS